MIYSPSPCKWLLALILWPAHVLQANMASPFMPGTQAASALSSQQMEVLYERLSIVTDSAFQKAFVRAEYTIRALRPGRQVPLLFLALEYDTLFKVFLDGQEVPTRSIRDEQPTSPGTWEGFSVNQATSGPDSLKPALLQVDWGDGFKPAYPYEFFRYFEADFSPGEHNVVAQYQAKVWRDMRGPVVVRSLRYALSPARFWKKFGGLEITLDARASGMPLHTNFGAPHQGRTDSIAIWKFQNIPVDVIQFTLIPPLTPSARFMHSVGADRIALAASITLLLLHIFFLYAYRRKNPTRRWSPVVWAGGLLIPGFVLLSGALAGAFLRGLLGPEAAPEQRYLFLLIVSYPIVTPFYLLLCLWLDRFFKRRLTKT